MAARKLADKRLFKGKVLTLRMSEEEMLKFKLSALALGKKRAVIVRERVADLIGGMPAVSPVATAPAGGGIGDTAIGATVAKGEAAGCLVMADSQAGATG